MKKEDIPFLNQLVKSLEESEPELEKAYEKKHHEKFNQIKKFMIKIQKQISSILNG